MEGIFRRKGRLGSLGMSLIELIVSATILAVVGMAVGGAMFVSSRSYTRNTAEIDVQEEAQIASNLITDWIVDAEAVSVEDSGNKLIVEHYEDGQLVTVTVQVVGSDLTYTAQSGSAKEGTLGAILGNGILASNVTGAVFDSDFENSRNVRFSIDFDINDRTYHSVTDTTSRNHDFTPVDSGPNVARPSIEFRNIPVTIDSKNFEVYLEPGQNEVSHPGTSFTLQAEVHNFDRSNTTFSLNNNRIGDTSCTMVDNGTNVFDITCSVDDKGKINGTYTFTATKTYTDADGNLKTLTDIKTLTIKIRRANECKFNVEELTAADVLSGTATKANCLYKPVAVSLGDHTYPRVGGAPYDNVFVDASTVQYFFRYADGSDASSVIDNANTVKITTGSPSIQIKLASDLTQTLYVVAVSTHQGVNPNSLASYNTGVTSNNRLVTQYSVAGWSYYNSVAKDVTYDVFKIEAATTPSTPPGYTDGGGFRRGTEAFRLGKFTDDFVTRLTQKLQAKGYNTAAGQNPLSYWSVLKYREAGTGVWKEYVVGHCQNLANITDYEMVKMVKAEASIFDLDKDYEFELRIDVWDSDLGRVLDPATELGGIDVDMTGTFPRVNSSVLNLRQDRIDSDNYIFESNAYSINNPYYYTKNGSDVYFYTFFTGMDPKGCKIAVQLEEGTSDGHGGYTWNSFSSHDGYNLYVDYNAFSEGGISTKGDWQPEVTKMTMDDADHTSYSIQGYSENSYPDPGVCIENIKVDQNTNLEAGKLYRIAFRTYFDQLSVTNPGTVGSSDGTVGGTASHNWYDLTSGDTDGYIYLKRS